MKKLILILLLFTPVWAFTQTNTFTDKEVVEMDSLFQVYEQTDSLQKLEIGLLNIQIGNYTTLHIQDSLHIAFMLEKTDLLNQRIELYMDLTKELRPKWYNKPVIHFFLGAATIVTASWVVSNVKQYLQYMALTNTDKKEIERIARKEIKDFMGKPQFKTEVQKVIADEIKKGRNTRSEIVDIVSKVMLELYKTFWFRRSMWQSEIKRVK